ncbi:MAG: hypothetical protein HY940_02390 [Gammaproteobacteria bacterium]|nr:hypothetical protein [Gammaproteobacteria bacterium]
MHSGYKFLIIVLALTLAVAGCKGKSTSSSTTTTTTTTTPAATTTSSGVKIGNGSGSGFVTGTLGIGLTTVSAGGTTSVIANLVDANNNVYSTPVDITFSSACSAQNLAALTSPIQTVNGTAITTYTAIGCNGADTVTASTVVDGTSLAATVNLTVLPAVVGSIQFVSATPTGISLKGTGGAGLAETSTIVFKVLDSTGGPVQNRAVDFALSTSVGGITLSSASGTTDLSGQVQTIVNSGTVATPVRVTATVTGTTISSQSDQLVISTGIPDQDSFSLAVETKNVPAAWETNGVNTSLTLFAGDHYNNPVPNGTPIHFRTEGGFVVSSCQTIDGQCSVTWTSNNPRPSNGRATVLAATLGEETFVDINGNGVFDTGDTFTDLPEVFLDANENGTHDAGEEFFDYNMNNTYDATDGKYNGLRCTHPTLCGTAKTVYVGSANVIVMSTNDPYDFTVTVYDTATSLPVVLPISLSATPHTYWVEVEDSRGQIPGLGSSLTWTTTLGNLPEPATKLIPNTNAPGPWAELFTISKKDTDANGTTGKMSIKLTLPDNSTVTVTLALLAAP